MSLAAKFFEAAKVRPAKAVEPAAPASFREFADADTASEEMLHAMCDKERWWTLPRTQRWCRLHGMAEDTAPVLLRMLTVEGFLVQDGDRWKVKLL